MGILNELVEALKYGAFFQNYSYDSEADTICKEFLKRKIDKVVMDSWNMDLFSGNLILRVWCANRYYAFASSLQLFKVEKNSNRSLISMRDVRPSFRILNVLKKIYLEEVERPVKREFEIKISKLEEVLSLIKES